MSGFKGDRPKPIRLHISGEIRQKAWCNLFKHFIRLCHCFCLIFSKIIKPTRFELVSFKTCYPKNHFKHRRKNIFFFLGTFNKCEKLSVKGSSKLLSFKRDNSCFCNLIGYKCVLANRNTETTHVSHKII